MSRLHNDAELRQEISQVLGVQIASSRPLGVGFGLVGLEVTLADQTKIAVKADLGKPRKDGSTLALEAYMLRELSRLTALPLPEVLHGSDQMLIMSWIENDGGDIDGPVQRHAAELLAELHAIRLPPPDSSSSGFGGRFGYARDTLIGPLSQPNPPSEKWIPFFREHRLFYMARLAHAEGKLPAELLTRIEALSANLDDHLIEPAHPSLIHGDLWSGNVLVGGGRIAGFVDPALYCAHREIELAFTTLFGTFGQPFFDAYHTLLPLEPGFRKHRCDIYNLYPLLVHVRLFGASYLRQVEATLRRLGY